MHEGSGWCVSNGTLLNKKHGQSKAETNSASPVPHRWCHVCLWRVLDHTKPSLCFLVDIRPSKRDLNTTHWEKSIDFSCRGMWSEATSALSPLESLFLLSMRCIRGKYLLQKMFLCLATAQGSKKCHGYSSSLQPSRLER